MTKKPVDDRWKLSKEQLDLIEHFEADYNAIDGFLRKTLASDTHVPFMYLVSEYSRKHTGWRDADLLRKVAAVRNSIVHTKTEPYRYVAVPTSGTVQSLKTCLDDLINPSRAIPTFQRKVETVSVRDTLARVLRIIAERDYSQFPVYEAERFCGLLTENGITRWLAHHVTAKLSLVELEDVPLAEVVKDEKNGRNYRFVARNARVDDVIGHFASQELLEAVLVTANGRESEGLLGIATRWDIVHIS